MRNYAQPVEITGSNHPRLFFNSAEIPGLQTKAKTSHQEIWLPIRDYVDSQLGTSPPVSAPSDGDLEFYRNAGNQLIPLAFACVISEDVDYCDLAKNYLLIYAGWEQWGENNWRDLGHAHMLLGNALAYDWLYDMLTAEERQIVRQSLTSWAQKMYEASRGPKRESWNNWWHSSYIQNHYSTNNSALGVAGLALLGEDDRAQLWIDQANSQISRTQDILNGIRDGSWHESIPYQSYLLTLSLPFMFNLEKIQGIDIIPHSYLRNYPYWRLYNFLPSSIQFSLPYGNFDWSWGNSYSPQNILRFAASRYRNGYAEWTAQQIIAADGRNVNVFATPWYVFEFLYYDASIGAHSPVDLARSRTFPDSESVIWRTGWGDDAVIFSFKAGVYGGRFAFDTFTQEIYPWDPPCRDTDCMFNFGHGHDDTNGFYIYRAGQWLAPETIGVGSVQTSFHNSLLIDGNGQYRPGDDQQEDPDAFIGSDGFLEATANSPDFDYLAADATRRYRNISGLEDITRHVLFVRPDYFIMLDNLAADAAHQYDWVSHFGESVSIEGNWVRGNAGSNQILGVGVVAPQSFEATTGNDGQPYVRIRPASPVADIRLINILYSTDNSSWNTKPTATLLNDTGEAVLVDVEMNDNSGRTDHVLLTYAPGALPTRVGPYEYDGRVAFVSRGTNGSLQKLFVYGGTYLKDQATDRVLVTNLTGSFPFEAAYVGSTVTVSGRIFAPVTLYAPQSEQLILNGAAWPFTRSGAYITFEAEPIYLPFILKGYQSDARNKNDDLAQT